MEKGSNEEGSGGLVQRGLRLVVGGFAEKAGLLRMRGASGPQEYFRFLSRHPRRLGFCLLWTAASGFGQTFFLSLFQPHWKEELGLSTAAMGTLYGAATLLSAAFLGKLGAWVDRTGQRQVALVAALGLAAGSVLGALSGHWVALLLAVALLRFFGQGLSAMLATTSAARWFREDQSKAVSVAGLGYPLGEAVLPGLVLVSMEVFGWRWTGALAAGVVLAVAYPVSLLLLRGRGPALGRSSEAEKGASGKGGAAAGSIYREGKFYVMLALTAPLPFCATGVIFFQATLGEALGWGVSAFAGGFFVFAVVRASFSLWVGALADRIGPVRLVGSPLLAFAAGLGFLALAGSWGVYAFFVCMGLAFGISGAITTPVWGELFGMERLGAARGASASVTVFATALAPVAFGAGLDSGVDARWLLLGAGVVMVVGLWPVSFKARQLARR